MKPPRNYIGIDIGSTICVAAQFSQPQNRIPLHEFSNEIGGFESLLLWFEQNEIPPSNTLICLENTGVYDEALCYFLHRHEYPLALESPKKVKKAFEEMGKSDPIDAQQIGEYAFRFLDKLKLWKPQEQKVAQMQVLLSTREQLTQQLTANKNMRQNLKRKVIQTPLANQIVEQTIGHLKKQIQQIDQEIKNLFREDPPTQQMLTCLLSIPSVGVLLAANLFVLSEGFSKPLKASQMAAYLGMAPLKYESGKSVYRKPKSRQEGPSRFRKLLYLATLSLRTHNPKFETYFLRKVAEGKPKRLILNNMANKLLRIICAVMQARSPYHSDYQSFHPALLKN